jgi:hypothetical protein
MAEILRIRDSLRIRPGRWFLILFLGVGIAAANDPERQIEAAIRQEVVLGDLKTAMQQYHEILTQPSLPRPIAARALYQTGQCLEKSGRRPEARNTYLRIAKEFNDQPEIAAQARDRLSEIENTVPGPLNLKFDQGQSGKLPDAWFVPVLPKDASQMAQLRAQGCMTRARCAIVMVPENAPVHAGNLMQSFSATAYRGKTVRLRAWLRLEASAPEDRAQMWLSVDRANDRKGFFDNMNDRPVVSADWTLCEIQTRVNDDATFIKFGVMSMGHGRVWVDSVSFETVTQ